MKSQSSFTRENKAKDWYKERFASLSTYPTRMGVAFHILTMRDYTIVLRKRKEVVSYTSLLGEDLSLPLNFINLLQKTTKRLRKFFRNDIPRGYALESIEGLPNEKDLKKVVTSVYKGKL